MKIDLIAKHLAQDGSTNILLVLIDQDTQFIWYLGPHKEDNSGLYQQLFDLNERPSIAFEEVSILIFSFEKHRLKVPRPPVIDEV